MRTTSSLESINSHIQRHFPSQTNIYHFMLNLKMYEAIKSSDLRQLFNDNITNQAFQRRRAADVIREEKVRSLTEKLMSGKISISKFLFSMSIGKKSGNSSKGVSSISKTIKKNTRKKNKWHNELSRTITIEFLWISLDFYGCQIMYHMTKIHRIKYLYR